MPLTKSNAVLFPWYAVSRSVRDLMMLVKLRLTLTVVFSAAIGYLFAPNGYIALTGLLALIMGGLLITGASNALNQVLEKDVDGIMKRTAGRPLPGNRMTPVQAILIAGVMGVGGMLILGFYFNYLAALIGAISLLTYAFIYTPLKRISNLAVFVGAIPGALPPVIGWVCATGEIHLTALVLFSIQFLWQFPHFWAIAWVAHDDYKRAGFNLLPSVSGRSRTSAFQNVMYAVFLIPVSLMPFWLGITGWASALVVMAAGLLFFVQALDLYRTCGIKSASNLMFGSFLYLPVVLTALLLDKL